MKRFQIVLGAALLLGTPKVSAWVGQVIVDYCGAKITEVEQLKEAGCDYNIAVLLTFGTTFI